MDNRPSATDILRDDDLRQYVSVYGYDVNAPVAPFVGKSHESSRLRVSDKNG